MTFLGRINTATFSDNTTKYTQTTYNATVLNYDPTAMKDGIMHIKDKLEAGRPVMVGVHYTVTYDPPKNSNRATRHFLVVVGYVKEKAGQEFFLFYDPATDDYSSGTSPDNKLFIYRQQNYIQGLHSGKTYTITEIIKTN